MEDSGIDSDPKTIGIGKRVENEEVAVYIDSSSSGNDHQMTRHSHRGLEKKIYDGKNNQQAEHKRNSGRNLIAIQRLPIPIRLNTPKEQMPLVEWDTDESEEDVHFFPMVRHHVRTELTDTFSIEEMELSADDEDDLGLLPPKNQVQAMPCCPLSVRCSVL